MPREIDTSDSNLPLSLQVWLSYDSYDYNNQPNLISATSILKPIKSLVLAKQASDLNKIVPIEALIPSALGTAIHTAIEEAWSDVDRVKATLKALNYRSTEVNINPKKADPSKINVWMEQRTNKEIEVDSLNGIDTFIISGKYDFVENGVLEDFKSTSTYNWMSQSNKDHYIKQGSIYRWLNPDIITEDYMYIRYIFTDWSATKAKQDSKYPQKRIISEKYPLLSIQETESFIRSKLVQVVLNENKPQSDMPVCSSEELWQRPEVYKYYKDPNKKTRSTKNFDNYAEAHQRWLNDGSVGEVVHVPGEVVYCKYCPVIGICEQAKHYLDTGLLNL